MGRLDLFHTEKSDLDPLDDIFLELPGSALLAHVTKHLDFFGDLESSEMNFPKMT